jgi:quercetin dioxygenase-like cupin family protein
MTVKFNADKTLAVTIIKVSGVWCKQMHFLTTGTTMPGHLHTHNHTTLLSRGKLRVTVNDASTDFTAPHMIFIHKDHVHELQALEDDTLAYCIHAIRDDDSGDIIDDLDIPAGTKIQDIIRTE